MRSKKSKPRLETSPLSFMFVLTFTVSAAMTGLFGLYPNNPITQQYRTVVARNVSPEFLTPLNGFLGLLNLQPIPEDQYQSGDGWVLDPGGWLLEQFGMTVPPLYGPDSVVVVFDPAGVLLELMGVDVAALPESSAPLDPAGSIFQQIGLTLPPDSPAENPPDPAGTLLAFLFPGYDPADEPEPSFDPGGMILAWIIPGYQPPPINDSQNPPPDPGGQLLAWLGSPELVNTSNNTLNPGDVILNWLFPPASEAPLPSEQDIVDAAMTSIVATQPNLASLATNTPTPTLTLIPTNALTLTPISTLTPTGTASSGVIVNPPPVNNPAPAPTATQTYTPVTYTVSYNANGATSGTTPASQIKIQGVALTLATNSGGLALTGSIFNGWNTMPDGSGTHYATGGVYTTDAALTLYAEWTVGCLNAITVTNANDSGTGSLRQAMIDLCPAGTITFAGNYVITLASQLPVVSNTMTITGNGAANTIIQAAASPNVATYIVFDVAASGNLTLNGVSVQNGVAPTYGGGIYNAGTLTVNNSTFSGNNGSVGAGICNWTGGTLTVTNSMFSGNISSNNGGGIMNAGTMTVTNSTFSGNSASVSGGGISNQGTMTVNNSTFSGNSTYAGGGIALSAGSTATVTNSTFSGNSADYGGGLDSQGALTVINNTLSGNSASIIGGGIGNEAGGTLYLRNTIIANSPTGGDCSNGATIVTNTNNLISDGSCFPAFSGNPLLGPLASNGGPTQTFALLAGSPAIDAGDDSSCPSTDQRGSSRPQGLHCDIGAYESSFSAPTPAGHTISAFSLNGGGSTVTVPGSSSVAVTYNYQVWGDSSTCPGCNYQLVWGLENNWQYCSAWTSPSPGDFPGLSGAGSPFNITAPAATGTYTIYSFSGQYADCTAAEAAYTSAGGTVQGTITVP